MKKLNAVYDTTEEKVISGLDLDRQLDIAPSPNVRKDNKGILRHISKPVAWVLAAGATAGGVALAVYSPTVLVAAAGGILGSASSFTTPVLKEVGRVNAFYIEVGNRLRTDWKLLTKPARKRLEIAEEKPPPSRGRPDDMPAPEISPADLDKINLQDAFKAKSKPQLPANDERPAAATPKQSARPAKPGE